MLFCDFENVWMNATYLVCWKSTFRNIESLLRDESLKWTSATVLFLFPLYRHHSAAEPLFIRPGKTANIITDGKNHVLHDLTTDAEEISPALYRKVMGKLRGKKEMELLERASHALHDTAKNYNITKLFHVFSMSFLVDQDGNTLERDVITADSNRHRCKKHDDNGKRGSCKDMRRDPYNKDCLGMCGPKCRCWSIICRNCCFHGGCYGHDRCCRHRHLSGYCLLPFFHSFSCKSYGGYPACLKAH